MNPLARAPSSGRITESRVSDTVRSAPTTTRSADGMRALACLLFVCGCNQVFGLRETVAIDAQQFDAPLDAPYACPAIGLQPAFGKILHQSIPKNCVSYTTSRSTRTGTRCSCTRRRTSAT